MIRIYLFLTFLSLNTVLFGQGLPKEDTKTLLDKRSETIESIINEINHNWN